MHSGAAAVNVRAIAQGASERNISVVVEGRQASARCAPRMRASICRPTTLSIGVIGPGTVGRVLLDQLASQQARLSREFKLDLRVRGIMASKRMLLSDRGVDLAQWKQQFEAGEGARRPGAFRRAREGGLPAAHGDHRLLRG